MISGLLAPLNKGTSLRLLKTDASKVPQYLWAEAFNKAVHINYGLPSSTIAGDSPHQKLFQKISDSSYFISKPLDVSVFLILMLHKETSFLKRKSLESFFVGYSEEHKHKGQDRFDESRFFSSIRIRLKFWGRILSSSSLE